MIGHVFITGLIGSDLDESGNVIERGIELQNVISQFQPLKSCELIHVHINSPGGRVDTGEKIAEYLKSFSNVVTIAEGRCASMATEIHLSVPKERRKIAQGTEYIIHQPMVSLQRGVALNQTQLDELSEDIGLTEKKMVSMYCKATGMDKTAISLLMKQETALTPEQCLEYGFVSEILPPATFKAVALIEPKTKKDNQMSELKNEVTGLKKMFADFAAKLTGTAKKQLALVTKKIALDLTTVDNFKIVVDTEDTIPKVGDKVMTEDGNVLDDGTYVFEQGKLVVKDGVIAEVLPPDAAEPNAEMEALKAELATLKAEREAEKTAIAELKEEFVKMSKLQSTYVPKTVKTAFADKGKGANEEVDKAKALKDRIAAKRAEAAKK